MPKTLKKGNKKSGNHVVIKNLDDGTEVVASVNPQEISVEKSVPWEKHKRSKGDNPTLEFTNAEPMNLSCEPFFDTYRSKRNVYKEHVERLISMTLVRKDAPTAEQRRPPHCLFIWGNEFPRFKGVIESLSIRYTKFLPDGTPVQATCAIKMQQAGQVKAKARTKKRKVPR